MSEIEIYYYHNFEVYAIKIIIIFDYITQSTRLYRVIQNIPMHDEYIFCTNHIIIFFKCNVINLISTLR